MASESLCSTVPQHQCSPLGLNLPSVQDRSEIELLKNRVADLERKFDENRNEVRQLMAELEIIQRTIDQRNQQVEPLENEIQPQVGWSIQNERVISFLLRVKSVLIQWHGVCGGYMVYGGMVGICLE